MIPGPPPPGDSAPPVADVHFIAGKQLIYLDAANVEWSVVEVAVDLAAVPGARRAHCLIFSRKDCIRRVWGYPAGWRQFDAAALESLSSQR